MSFVITEVKDAGRLEDEEESGSYTFHWMDSTFEGLSTKEIKDRFLKWNIDQNLRVAKFRYDQEWKKGESTETLITDFLNSRVFQDNIKVRGQKGWEGVGTVTKVTVEEIAASATSCSVFDPLLDTEELVSPEGYMRRCAPDELDGVQFDDEMKRAMLDEDCEHYDEIDEELRSEFIFHLFKHFVFGGCLNQYEENITPYVETVKSVYRDLMSVSKNKNTGKLEIASQVFALKGIRATTPLFPSDSPLNVCFVVIDPFRRQLCWYYFANCGLWG